MFYFVAYFVLGRHDVEIDKQMSLTEGDCAVGLTLKAV